MGVSFKLRLVEPASKRSHHFISSKVSCQASRVKFFDEILIKRAFRKAQLVSMEKELLLNMISTSKLFKEIFVPYNTKIFIMVILGLKGAKTGELHVHGDKELRLSTECISHLVFTTSLVVKGVAESVNEKYLPCMHSL